jgi:hypothetical protein
MLEIFLFSILFFFEMPDLKWLISPSQTKQLFEFQILYKNIIHTQYGILSFIDSNKTLQLQGSGSYWWGRCA